MTQQDADAAQDVVTGIISNLDHDVYMIRATVGVLNQQNL